MKKTITYKSSGVDISKANRFVSEIQPFVKKTMTGAVLKDKGAFGSLFAFPKGQYAEPILVSSTDGVGTKLLIAQAVNKHDTVGIDLVAMNVNDILCCGARPLFFLDYIACGKVDVFTLKEVVRGIVDGCQLAGCSLIGGETAEMPGLYKEKEYDLAGFAVGVVDKKKIIDGSKIKAGDKVIGLVSHGLHSNGFSLVRKVFSLREQKLYSRELLKPTKIYAREVLSVIDEFPIKGIAHITGGAFYEKLTKVLPDGKSFRINKKSWPILKIFTKIQVEGNISDCEMYRTFNMGIGMALIVNREDSYRIRSFILKKGTNCYEIGEVVKDKQEKLIFI